jgi:putative glycosyltransferase (TIGR04372 family)
MGFDRLIDSIKFKVGPFFARSVQVIIIVITFCTPLFLIKLFPKSMAPLFGSCALSVGMSRTRIFAWSSRAVNSNYSGHRKASVFLKLNYLFAQDESMDLKLFLVHEFSNFENKNELDEIYKVWSYHNNSQRNFTIFLLNSISNLERLDLQHDPDAMRYLPEHTTNMGHLSALFLYANFYRKYDPLRKIVIWPDISPNKYYLNEIVKIIPFQVILRKGAPDISNLRQNQIDTLSLSRLSPGNWRIEPNAQIPVKQEFPEFEITDDFKLTCSEILSDSAIEKLSSIGFDSKKWFVIFHIKEHKQGYPFGGETRDADIETYKQAASLINELGGQVIRMGSKNFPPISRGFQAIDYAHASVNSSEIDYWLWGNCLFWVGNGNGTIWAPLSFGKPRLITNQWPLSPWGPKTDMFLPKLIFDDATKRVLTPQEMVDMRLSRSMKRKLFKQSSLSLIDNSPKLIESATLEMYEFTQSNFLIKSNSASNFENDIKRAVSIDSNSQSMRVPQTFNDFLAEFM